MAAFEAVWVCVRFSFGIDRSVFGLDYGAGIGFFVFTRARTSVLGTASVVKFSDAGSSAFFSGVTGTLSFLVGFFGTGLGLMTLSSGRLCSSLFFPRLRSCDGNLFRSYVWFSFGSVVSADLRLPDHRPDATACFGLVSSRSFFTLRPNL
jgi:hypothetical protein